LSLSIFNAADHPLIGTESMAQLIRETDQVSALAAYLLYEAGNRSSFYRPYLCALPRSVPLPAFSRYADLQTSGLARSATFIRSVELMRKVSSEAPPTLDSRPALS
jgi:hypothetical protein